MRWPSSLTSQRNSMLQASLAYRFCSAIESGIVLSRRLYTRESVISVISFLDGLKYTDYEAGDHRSQPLPGDRLTGS